MRKLLTFPRLIFATSIACAFIMVKYRSPAPQITKAERAPAIKPVLAPPVFIAKAEKPAVIPAPIVLAPVEKKAPIKVKAKRLARKARIKPAPVLMPEPNEFPSLDNELETVSGALALDASSPVDELVIAAFDEPSLTPIRAEMPAELPNDLPPREARLIDVVGVLRPTDFSETSGRLARLHAEFQALNKDQGESSPFNSESIVAQRSASPTTDVTPGPVLVTPPHLTKRAAQPVERVNLTPRQAGIFVPEISLSEVLDASPEESSPTLATSPTEPSGPTLVNASRASSPKLAIASPFSSPLMVIRRENEATSAGATTQNATRTLTTQFATPEASFEGNIQGELFIEDEARVMQWLGNRKRRGHIEVYLRPLGSPHMEDLIPSDQITPDPRFSFQERKWRGAYRLTAGIFFRDSLQPEAEIHYAGNPITYDNHRENHRFYIKKDQIKSALDAARRPSATGSSLTAIIYEAVPGDHRIMTKIQGATVRILGLPSIKPSSSSAMGEIKISSLPSRSEVVLEVSAAGYLPTYRVVVTSQKHTHIPIYLVREKWVKAATTFPSVGTPQHPNAGVVIGRVFDSSTQEPEIDQKVQISSRDQECGMGLDSSERVYYFKDVFPYPLLPATTSTGFFAFFNVGPCLRRILRPDLRTMMLQVRTGSADYIELGRAGKSDLLGKLLASSDGTLTPVPDVKVRLARDPKSETETDENGHFEISDIDLPAGVIHLETKAHGFANAWHPVRWDPKARVRRRVFYLVPKHEAPQSEARSGVIIGMAKPAFYGDAEGCFKVRLLDAMGSPVPAEKGPFALTHRGIDKSGALCLTASSRGYAFTDLARGEYFLQWSSPKNELYRAHVLQVGPGRATISVD